MNVVSLSTKIEDDVLKLICMYVTNTGESFHLPSMYLDEEGLVFSRVVVKDGKNISTLMKYLNSNTYLGYMESVKSDSEKLKAFVESIKTKEVKNDIT